MPTDRRPRWAFGGLVALLTLAGSAAHAQQCEPGRLLAAGKHYLCLMNAQAKAIKTTGAVAGAGEPKCNAAFLAKWARASSYPDCPSVLDGSVVQASDVAHTAALTGVLSPGAPTPSRCTAQKARQAGRYATCRLLARRREVRDGTPLDVASCEAKLTAAFDLAEGLAAPDCLTTGDLEGIRALVTGQTDELVAAIGGFPPATTTTTTTTTSTTTTTLAAPSDDFGGGVLDPSWSILNPSIATVSVSGGQLHLQVDTLSNWFNTWESVLVYKEVTGDFDVRAVVHATRTSDLGSEPVPQYRLGGLLARDPASTPAVSNFVHVAVGTGSFAEPQTTEDKTTDDSSSLFTFHAVTSTESELRLTRTGNTFSMYARPVSGGTWTLLGTHVRPDLPATLQVGPMAYDFNGAPDLTVHFDAVIFD